MGHYFIRVFDNFLDGSYHQVPVLRHDPVITLLCQHILPLRQVLYQRSKFYTAMLGCRTRRQNHHWLIGKVAELAGTCRADREVFQLARDRKRELWLNPENGRHGLFICREGRKPGTRNGSSVGRRPAADEAHQMTPRSFSAGGQKKSTETNRSEEREDW